MLLAQDDILPRLGQLARESKRINLATAWASPGKALDALLSGGRSIRAIVGIAGSATFPGVFQQLHDARAEVRIPSLHPLFHPKLIVFELENKTVVWVGSANLTLSGYEVNTEVIAEFEDDGKALSWFEVHWDTLKGDHSQTIANYAKNWVPPKGNRGGSSGTKKQGRAKPSKNNLTADLSDWPSFVRAIKKADEDWSSTQYWSVTGEMASWLNTASLGNSIIVREDWDSLAYHEYRILLGLELKGDQTAYGLLGSMKGAGQAKEYFRQNTVSNRRVRQKIRKSLQVVIDANFDDFPEAASQFIAEATSIERIGSAVASRFITLARPDLGISVNSASRKSLAELTGLPPTTLGAPTSARGKSGYGAMIRMLQQREWYANPKPADHYEQTLSDMRGALLDSLIYQV